MKTRFLFLTLAFCFSVQLVAQNTNSLPDDEPEFLPEPIEFVYDMEGYFSSDELKRFRDTAASFEAESGNEVILLIFNHTAEFEDLETFAYMMGNEMNPGKEGKSNGVAIVYCTELNDLEIVPMEGAKKIITDKFIYTLKEKKINPLLENEQALQALQLTLEEIIKKWPKEKS